MKFLENNKRNNYVSGTGELFRKRSRLSQKLSVLTILFESRFCCCCLFDCLVCFRVFCFLFSLFTVVVVVFVLFCFVLFCFVLLLLLFVCLFFGGGVKGFG